MRYKLTEKYKNFPKQKISILRRDNRIISQTLSIKINLELTRINWIGMFLDNGLAHYLFIYPARRFFLVSFQYLSAKATPSQKLKNSPVTI